MNDPFEPALPWGDKRPRSLAKYILKLCHGLSGDRRFNYKIIKTLRAPIKAGRPRAFDVRVRNLNLRLVSKGNYCETTALFAPQFYDVTELRWLSGELADGGVFLDIGGNVGLYSLIIGGEQRDGTRIFAVEPDPELGRRMLFNATENGIDIRLCPLALSDYEGQGRMQVSSHQRGENFLTDDAREGEDSVRVTTLHKLCNELGIESIRALKIDVEGHEHRILSDFFERADPSLWPVAIVIEHVHDSQDTITMIVERHHYEVVGRSGRNVMLRRSTPTEVTPGA